MEIKRIKLGQQIWTLERFVNTYNKMPVQAYDSEKQNKTLKLTKKNCENYVVISAYEHDDFIMVYCRKTMPWRKQRRKSK